MKECTNIYVLKLNLYAVVGVNKGIHGALDIVKYDNCLPDHFPFIKSKVLVVFLKNISNSFCNTTYIQTKLLLKEEVI